MPQHGEKRFVVHWVSEERIPPDGDFNPDRDLTYDRKEFDDKQSAIAHAKKVFTIWEWANVQIEEYLVSRWDGIRHGRWEGTDKYIWEHGERT